MSVRARSNNIETLYKRERQGLLPLRLEVYWPERNPEPHYRINAGADGSWILPEDLLWLRDQIDVLIKAGSES